MVYLPEPVTSKFIKIKFFDFFEEGDLKKCVT